MNNRDYFLQSKRKQIAVHHVLEEYMDAYLEAAGIRDDKTTPLFRTAYKKTGTLTENRLTQPDAWDMLQRRAKKAGITTVNRPGFAGGSSL